MSKATEQRPALRKRCVECSTLTEMWVLGWDDQYRCINDASKGPRPSGGGTTCPTCGGSGRVRSA